MLETRLLIPTWTKSGMIKLYPFATGFKAQRSSWRLNSKTLVLNDSQGSYSSTSASSGFANGSNGSSGSSGTVGAVSGARPTNNSAVIPNAHATSRRHDVLTQSSLVSGVFRSPSGRLAGTWPRTVPKVAAGANLFLRIHRLGGNQERMAEWMNSVKRWK